MFTSRWTCFTWNVRNQHESQMTLNIHIHAHHVIMSNEPLVTAPEHHILNSNLNELQSASVPDRHAQFHETNLKSTYLVRSSHLPNTLVLSSCLILSVKNSATEVTNITKLNIKHVNIQLVQDTLCTHHQILIWTKNEIDLPINQILIIFQMHDMYSLTNPQTITLYEFNTHCVSFLKLFHKCGPICKTNVTSQGSSQLNEMQKDSK